jgi:hypothetical protein
VGPSDRNDGLVPNGVLLTLPVRRGLWVLAWTVPLDGDANG